jgi:hypothetical protein
VLVQPAPGGWIASQVRLSVVRGFNPVALGELYGYRRFHVLLLFTKEILLRRAACLAEFNRYLPYLTAVILNEYGNGAHKRGVLPLRNGSEIR